MTDLMIPISWVKQAGFISDVDDFMVSVKQADANETWENTVAALKQIGLNTDEAKSRYSREWRTEWEHETLQHKANP